MADSIGQAIGLDLGTTAIKAGVFSRHGHLMDIFSSDAPEISVMDGRYESDALLYVETVEQLILNCLSHSNHHPDLGIACQRSSFLLWEKVSGKPVTPLISWQDNRGGVSIDRLASKQSDIQKLTGLRLTAYYFAPKLNVLLEQQSELRKRLEQGELLVGTLDCFLIWRWSSGSYYQTDASIAARTLLMSITQHQWSSVLCGLFSINQQLLPEILPSCGLNQPIKHGMILRASIADQSAALLASIATDTKQVLVNLGTGGFVIRYLPSQPEFAINGYLKTLVYQDQTGDCYYAIEGTLNSIAHALEGYPYKDCKINDLGRCEAIYCLAEPAGIGAPYFKDDLGLIFSESIDHLSQQHIAALLLEAIIFRVVRIVEEFSQHYPVNKVVLSGGLATLSSLQQGIAVCCQTDVHRLVEQQSTLLGAGLLALGMASGDRVETIQITHNRPMPVIVKKYQRWKNWLDTKLEAE